MGKVSDCDKTTTDTQEINECADFETAMKVAGFGKFNLLLVVVAAAATFGNMFETTTMSFILPIAECDLKLTMLNKGVLNAATYGGMIASAIIWGYLADTLGRKKILVYGYLADAVCVFGSSLSQNFEMLVAFKFLGGFIVSGPGAVLFTYLTELHSAKYRPSVLMVVGMITSTGTLLVPLLAWAIFPRDWDFKLFGALNVHTWQIFLATCGLASLSAGLLLMLLPESPKFLMSQGRNADALRAFQKIYSYNTNKPRETYPIRMLVEEVPSRKGNATEVVYTIDPTNIKRKAPKERRSFTEALRDGMKQMKPMFHKPLLGHSIHVYVMNFCILLGLNTIRLWLPQLFASIAEFESLNSPDLGQSSMCNILSFSANKTAETASQTDRSCENATSISIDMYINNIIVSAAGLVGYCLASGIVKLVGAKRMMTIGLVLSGSLGIGLYWSTNSLSTLIISSLFITVASISTSSLLGLAVMLFPTSLRTLIVCIAMMFGRLGALSGNILFPVLVGIGCIPPFLMVGCAMLFAGVLSLVIPSPRKAVFT